MATKKYLNPFIGLYLGTTGSDIIANPTPAIDDSTDVPADTRFINLASSTNSSVMTATFEYTASVDPGTPLGTDVTFNVPGRKDGSLAIDFYIDYGATEIVNRLFPLLGQVVRVKLRSASADVSASNPNIFFDAAVGGVPMLSVGDDIATGSVTWPIYGQVRLVTA